MNTLQTTTVALAALTLAACATSHGFRVAGAPAYDPVPPDSVAVYEAPEDLPCGTWERLADVEADGTLLNTAAGLRDRLREEAAEFGANALLLGGASSQGFGEHLFSFDATVHKARGAALRLNCQEAADA